MSEPTVAASTLEAQAPAAVDADPSNGFPGKHLDRAVKALSTVAADERRRVETALRKLELHDPTRIDMEAFAASVGPALSQFGRRMHATVIELGRWFLRVKARTPHGLFGDLFRDGRHPVDSCLPITRQVAERYMRVAADPALSDARLRGRLPLHSLGTLDALGRAMRHGLDVRGLVLRGQITPETTRQDVERLLAVADTPPALRDPLADVRRALRDYFREGQAPAPLLNVLRDAIVSAERLLAGQTMPRRDDEDDELEHDDDAQAEHAIDPTPPEWSRSDD
jgi:hypothetical protein